jgi:predicted phosphodiesterase
MPLAALYDIHGNLPALEAVLDEALAAGIDRIVVGGDVVPGPMPCESLDCLLALEVPVECILGNGEIAVLAEIDGRGAGAAPEAAREAVRWVARQLEPRHVSFLRTWPETLQLEIERLGRVLFCHATPRNATEIFTLRTAEEVLLPVFAQGGAPLVVCGHTHMPFDRRIGATRVINAGSVGMPIGEPGSCWLRLGPGVEPRRSAYDTRAAAEVIRATQSPDAERFAAENVLSTPSEAKMLEVFARAELS